VKFWHAHGLSHINGWAGVREGSLSCQVTASGWPTTG